MLVGDATVRHRVLGRKAPTGHHSTSGWQDRDHRKLAVAQSARLEQRCVPLVQITRIRRLLKWIHGARCLIRTEHRTVPTTGAHRTQAALTQLLDCRVVLHHDPSSRSFRPRANSKHRRPAAWSSGQPMHSPNRPPPSPVLSPRSEQRPVLEAVPQVLTVRHQAQGDVLIPNKAERPQRRAAAAPSGRGAESGSARSPRARRP
jgi:hypothetical protein